MIDLIGFMKHIASPGHISFKPLNAVILLASNINIFFIFLFMHFFVQGG